MARYRSRIAVCLLATAAIVISTTLASSGGAAGGFSGGPTGYTSGGGNCTACHNDFVQGPGRVEILGAPRRYRANAIYDLTIRITDPGQKGAGFEVSAENAIGHVGDLIVSDSQHTAFTDGGTLDYITHTSKGVTDSIAGWTANGGSFDYTLQWQAPAVNAGQITLYAAGNAVNDAIVYLGDHYYQNYATLDYAVPGDGDGDTDLDLRDFAVLQRCFNDLDAAVGDGCAFVDFDHDTLVSLSDVKIFVASRTGPASTLPAEYVLADTARGGLLYDKWWIVNGAPEPVTEHPLYPDAGQQSGSMTYRCKECHGWDYKGKDGVYGIGSHYTGIVGIDNTTIAPRTLFDLLKADPNEVPNGHNMDVYGLSDADLWDLVKFSLEGTVDTDNYIDDNNLFLGNTQSGYFSYRDTCQSCHGSDGKKMNFGDTLDPEYVGTIAVNNPWEFLHTVRFSHPGTSMPSAERLYWPITQVADIGAHAQTLPVE